MNQHSKEPEGSGSGRPEFESELVDSGVIGDIERPLSFAERVVNNEGMQRLAILLVTPFRHRRLSHRL